MPTETATDITSITPITRATDARQVALGAYEQLLGLLRRLETGHWDAPTDCDAWHVADMVRHLLGGAKGYSSVWRMLPEQAWGMLHKGDHDDNPLDAINDRHVRQHAHLSPGQLVTQLRDVAPGAVAGRLAMPRLLRRVTVPVEATGSVDAGMPRTLHIAHLLDVVLTRDVWLHGIDIERATGVPVDRSRGLDGRIVQDVVADWARRHGQPVELTLTGPAGGRYRQGSGGEHHELDAIEFCRTISGRAQGDGLLAQHVWF